MNFYTTDTHYGHPNIVRGITSWKNELGEVDIEGTRDFQTLNEMNDAIVNAINSVVGPDDTLYHDGDWSLGGIQNIWEFRKRLNVKTIHLVLGNHDEQLEENKWVTIKKEDYELYTELTGNEIHFTGESYLVRSRSFFTSVSWYKKIHVKGLRAPITMGHFACRVWLKSHKGGIYLHGHSHGSLIPYGNEDNLYKTMDLYREDFIPYSEDEILKIMAGRVVVKGIDHHGGSR